MDTWTNNTPKPLCFILLIPTLLFLIGCSLENNIEQSHDTETILFQSSSRGEKKLVAAFLSIPKVMVSPVPLIITQHGSSRDGIRFPNSTGKTDEFSSRIIKTGIDRGFAVVAIDAFYKTDLKPNNKGQFPNAYQYALDLKHIFSTACL